jgi:hypothetical protein
MRKAGIREARQNLTSLLDTRALAKLFVAEDGSDELNAALVGPRTSSWRIWR